MPELDVPALYGSLVFSESVMRQTLPPDICAAIERTMPAAEPETESEGEAEAQTLDIPAVSPDQVTMVGDSVMLGALPALQTAM